MKVIRILTRKVRLWRFGLPAWTVALVLATVTAFAGQAVGPVLSGAVTGSVGLTVSQGVTVDTDAALGSNPVVASGGGDWAATRNDEGTEFTVAAEMRVGENVKVNVYLQNSSSKDAAALLELNVPKGIEVELAEISNGVVGTDTSVVIEAQFSRNTWLLVARSATGTGENDGIQITIETKDDVAPGFYTLTGRIIQIEG